MTVRLKKMTAYSIKFYICTSFLSFLNYFSFIQFHFILLLSNPQLPFVPFTKNAWQRTEKIKQKLSN